MDSINIISDKIYPPFTEERRNVRQQWNKENTYISWPDYLFYKSIDRCLKENINPYKP